MDSCSLLGVDLSIPLRKSPVKAPGESADSVSLGARQYHRSRYSACHSQRLWPGQQTIVAVGGLPGRRDRHQLILVCHIVALKALSFD